jgi:hypothetical protein
VPDGISDIILKKISGMNNTEKDLVIDYLQKEISSAKKDIVTLKAKK